VVATSTEKEDDAVAEWCRQNGISAYRGSLHDVLDRFYQAACFYRADVIVRITADCPVLDPAVLGEVLEGFLAGSYDFYGLKGEFPDGLDCTVFSAPALERAWLEARLPSEREHVGPYLEKNPHLFRVGGVEKFHGLGHMRWTLDEPRDYQFLREIFGRLHQPGRFFSTQEILALLEREPSLAALNRGIPRSEGYAKSLQHDRAPHG
jgi:spore coat polysaccharide biosynthesis protein SpsF